jgi:hypothetical protein
LDIILGLLPIMRSTCTDRQTDSQRCVIMTSSRASQLVLPGYVLGQPGTEVDMRVQSFAARPFSYRVMHCGYSVTHVAC